MRSPLPVPVARRLPYGALAGTVVVLYFAREVLVPLAVALLFSFLLGPVVRPAGKARFFARVKPAKPAGNSPEAQNLVA